MRMFQTLILSALILPAIGFTQASPQTATPPNTYGVVTETLFGNEKVKSLEFTTTNNLSDEEYFQPWNHLISIPAYQLKPAGPGQLQYVPNFEKGFAYICNNDYLDVEYITEAPENRRFFSCRQDDTKSKAPADSITIYMQSPSGKSQFSLPYYAHFTEQQLLVEKIK